MRKPALMPDCMPDCLYLLRLPLLLLLSPPLLVLLHSSCINAKVVWHSRERHTWH